VSAIAIVGMGCRFAGAHDLQHFWRLIRQGQDAFGPVPADRWDGEAFYSTSGRDADRSTTPTGAFLDDVRSFPALALGIPPRRVEVMDPQQRFTIETSLQAIEDAGYAPAQLPPNTGVYVGLTAHEYRVLLGSRISALMMATGQMGRAPEDPTSLIEAIERVLPARPFTAPGVLGNMAAAAVAQELNFHGPAYTLDAACASAMIAVADAVDHLRSGKIDAALAGGAYLQLTPEHFVAFSRIGAMSVSGRCLPFDARADGFVQGDGVGMVLLKRLEDAERDGDRIYAIVRGVAINNDGRGDGPMAPLVEGQTAAIAAALRDAGADAHRVGYVETHGTGTQVGDLTEINGLREVFGDQASLAIGSVKANIGHTMSAAGIAGLIKAALAIHHAVIPPMAGFEQPRDDLHLDHTRIRVPTRAEAWNDPDRLAGISSFGFGGTNAHAVLSASTPAPAVADDNLHLVTFSAPDEPTLRLAASEIAAAVRDADDSVAGVARALAARRPLPARAAIVAGTRAELLTALDALATGQEAPVGARFGTSNGAPRIAFLYPGQGAQRLGMLRDLRKRFPTVAASLASLGEALDGELALPLHELLYPEERSHPVPTEQAETELTATEHCQPAMLATSLALTELLASVGVRPHVVTGHSLGEFTAAAAAGVLPAADVARFVARRGRAMADLPGDHGAMAAVMASAAEVEPLLVDGAVIANHNHPRQVVISGTREAVAEVMRRALAQEISAKPLVVSHAFHSPVLETLDAASLIADLRFGDPQVPVASAILDHTWQTANDAREVFLRHATSPVRFTDALTRCREAGADLYLQVGAGGPLASFARGSAHRDHRGVYTLASLDDNDRGFSLLDTLGALWVAGVDLDVRPISAPARLASMPPSPLAREVYWCIKDEAQRPMKIAGATHRPRPEPAPVVAHIPEEAAAPAPLDADDATNGVLAVVSKVSAYPLAALRASMRLVDDLGFDSLMIGDLSAGLAERFPGLGGIPQSVLINGPTIADLIAYVATGGADTAEADDDTPLTRYRPVWRRAPLPDLPARAVPTGLYAVSGDNPARAEHLALGLCGRGFNARPIAPEDLDHLDLAGLIWLLPSEVPDLGTVLAGRAPVPDPSAALLRVLASQAQAGRHPDVIAVSTTSSPWHAGPAGAVRALAREWPEAVLKHLTLDPMPHLADRVADELLSADRTAEVRYAGSSREVQGFEPLPDVNAASPVGADDTVLITGGTRGIGLQLGLRLASLGARVLLLGRGSPEDAAAISAFPTIEVLTADVTDRPALRAAAAGRGVTVLIHAAGLLADGPIEQVDPMQGARAREVKVGGWLNALSACGPSLRRAVAVGSWAGRFGNRHQAHYAAANAQLAALTEGIPGVQAVVGEFGPWTDSAMVATIPGPARAAMRAEGVDFVGAEAGLTALIGDLSVPGGAIVHGRRVPSTTRRTRVDLRLSTTTDPYLLDHAIEGVPVLPLAAATDLIGWTAALPAPFEVLDVRLFRGVLVREPVDLRIEVEAGRARLRLADGTLCYEARVASFEPAEIAPAPTGGEPPTLPLRTFYDEVTFHGPLLQGIEQIDAVGPDFIRGRIRAGRPRDWTPASPRAAFSVDPLALDSAMQLSAWVAWVRYQRAGTPVSLGSAQVITPLVPGRTYLAEARFGEATDDRFSADLILREEDGTPVLVCRDVVAELRRADKTDSAYTPRPEDNDPAQWPEVRALRDRFTALAAAGLPNPYFHVHEGTARNITVVGGRELVNFSSYNYIGLSGDPDVLARVHEAVERYGTSVSASRVASGERPFHGELERLLAQAQGAEAALLFTAGHATNVTTIGHLLGPEDLVLHDEYIHDSALQGIKLSGAARRGFRHEDPAHLEQQLTQLRSHYRRCLIVVEGVYSMDGDICSLPAYVAIKKRHGCLLMVDEAHSFGIVGATGRGVAEHHGIDGREVDIWMGTLSKSLASCGGWIAGSTALIDYLRYTAPGFVYSAGLTAANGVAALASLEKMLAEPERVLKLQDNAAFFHARLMEQQLDTGPARGGSGVVPVITGNSLHAMLLSAQLREAGVNVQPIVYPAVPEDAARLRFFLSSTHTREQLAQTAHLVGTILRGIREATAHG
jgi:8-amino-7-oxononanoate synthase